MPFHLYQPFQRHIRLNYPNSIFAGSQRQRIVSERYEAYDEVGGSRELLQAGEVFMPTSQPTRPALEHLYRIISVI